MTACVNEQKKKMGGGVFSSKVLRAVMAFVLAIGLMPTVSMSAWAAARTIAYDDQLTYTGEPLDVTLTITDTKTPDHNWRVSIVQDGNVLAQSEILDSDSSWTANGPDGVKAKLTFKDAVTNAGTYETKVEFLEGNEWREVEGITAGTEFTVDKATVVASAKNLSANSATYTGKDIDIKGYYQLQAGGVDIDSALWTVDPATAKDAGAYGPVHAVLTEEGFQNYTFGNGTNTSNDLAEFTVTAAQPIVAWTDAAAEALHGTIDGGTLTVAHTGGTIPVKASDISVTGVDGYVFTAGTDYDVEFGIQRADGTFSPVDSIVAEGTYQVSVAPKATAATANYDFTNAKLTVVVGETANMTKNQAFAKGEIVAAKDNENYTLDVSKDVEWTYDGEGHGVVVEKVLPKGEAEAVDVTTAEFAQKTYEVDKDGKITDKEVVNPANAGTYAVVVTPQSGPYYPADATEAQSFVFYYTINPVDVSGAYAFDDSNIVRDLADREFTWNAGAQEVGIALDGKVLTDPAAAVTTTYYKADKATEVPDITIPGTYYVAFKAVGPNYTGEGQLEVVVNKLDLADAGLFVNDVDAVSADALDYVQLSADSPVVNEVNFKHEIQASLDKAMTSYGEYTVTVTPKAQLDDDATAGDRESYVTGSWTGTFDYVGQVIDEFYYGNEELSAWSGEVFSNQHEGRGFDPDQISVWEDKAANKQLSKDDYKVTVTKDGQVVTSYDEPGEYVVTVEVQAADYSMGGKAQATFRVVAGSLGDADIVVTNTATDKVVPTRIAEVTSEAISFEYDGTDKSAMFDVAVDVNDEELIAGTDYRLVITTGAPYYVPNTSHVNDEAKVVDSATTVGTYYLNIIGVTYADWTAVEFEVTPLVVKRLRIAQESFDWNDGAFHKGETAGIPYTGSAVSPVVEYTADGKTWSALPTELFRLTGFQSYDKAKKAWNDVEGDIVEVGKYRVSVELLDCDLAGNYDFGATADKPLRFYVIDRVAFDDVQSSQWYAHRVVEAYNAGYINGYAGTKLFGPDNAIKRGDVACILFNVGSMTNVADQDWWINQGASVSAFDDVAVGEYWTAAINWAASAQVVNGYEGTSLFDPEANITREAFASMLANYAKATKDYVAPTTDISGMPGADGVSGWALENVQWAVENGIMGNNGADLNAQGTITRAEVAAMVMNFTEKF